MSAGEYFPKHLHSTSNNIFLCIPATVATAERSFSKHKLIKNYLRNTMTQEHRLVDLAWFSLEWKLVRKINFDDVVNTFTSKKDRNRFQMNENVTLIFIVTFYFWDGREGSQKLSCSE